MRIPRNTLPLCVLDENYSEDTVILLSEIIYNYIEAEEVQKGFRLNKASH